MADEQTKTAAVAHIHTELGRLKRHRLVVLGLSLTLVLGVCLLAFFSQENIAPRAEHGRWLLALWILGACTVVATSAAIGVPLVRGSWFNALGLGSLFGLLIAMAIATDWGSRTAPPVAAGVKCFTFGTGASVVAMVVLGIISGRTWRRFPNPGLALAVGATAFSAILLHIRCGGAHPLHLFGFHLTPFLVSYAASRSLLKLREQVLQDWGR